ncbi:preprotein translocase subunit SecA [bacterium]|nr:MAG: preprotein translocase subunit SecA [bacterium]RIK65082.1 MAG: preprotein translocase subunit SecA [Planctomycetota bacterium]
MPLLDTVLRFFIGSRNERLVKALWPTVNRILDLFPKTNALSDAELKDYTARLKERRRDGESLEDLLVEAFALVREASWRVLGNRQMVKDPVSGETIPYKAHFPVQLMGGIVLHQGKIAEMVTGEGKTFVATPAAFLNALDGRGVHVVTVNDYLARRDAEEQGRVLALLGMSCGYILTDMDNEERREMYARDITYGTNNEFGFDYLRDNMKVDPRTQVQRELHYAIIDEVDSILIDEARTPLIISGAAEDNAAKYAKADEIAKTLKGIDSEKLKDIIVTKHGKAALQDKQLYLDELNHYDFEVKEKESQALLTERGVSKVEKALGVKHLYDGVHMEWPHLMEQALRANNLFKLDKEYVVHEGEDGPEIVIVDEFTGRLQHGRRWSDGLHQAVEAKHGIRVRAESQTLATITLQNYFKLYNKISGMTGSAMTEAAEFEKIYKLDVVAIPTNRPLIRADNEDLIYGTADEKWAAICEEIEKVHKTGRPILVGTTSVEKSEHLSRLLNARGLKHNTLNAKFHAREAEIVAQAGRKGQITVSTNMAGRGTDILLGGNPKFMALQALRAEGKKLEDFLPEEFRGVEGWRIPRDTLFAAELAWDRAVDEKAREFRPAIDAEHEEIVKLGGLQVIGTERHESRRIDNQLRGRCGRQGDPGSSQFFISLDDDLMRMFAGPRMKGIMQKLGLKDGQPIQARMVSKSVERAQKKVEQRNFDIRKNLIEYDDVNNGQRKAVYKKRQIVLAGMHRADFLALQTAARKKVVEVVKELDKVSDVSDQTRISAIVANKLAHWADEEHEAEIPDDALREQTVEEAVLRLAHTIRGKVHADRLREDLLDRIYNVIAASMQRNIKDPERHDTWNFVEIAADYRRVFNAEVDPKDMPRGMGGPEAVTKLQTWLYDRAVKLYEERERRICSDPTGAALKTPAGRPATGRMRQLERYLVLQSLDQHWKDHLKNLEIIKGSIHWESYAQKDPKDAYKKKGHEAFEAMLDSVDHEVVSTIFRIEVQFEEAPQVREVRQAQALHPAVTTTTSGGGAEMAPPAMPAEPEMPKPSEAQEQTRRQMQQAVQPSRDTGFMAHKKKLPGPNDPCHCGSGKKYKKCHMASDQAGSGQPGATTLRG